MANLREQMEKLALELTRSSEERRRALTRRRAELERLRARFARERQRTAQQVRQETTRVVHSLQNGHEDLRRQVGRVVSEMRSRRERAAVEQMQNRQRVIGNVRTSVTRSLQRNRADRLQANRQMKLSHEQALAKIRRRVSALCQESKQFTQRIAADLSASRAFAAAVQSNGRGSESSVASAEGTELGTMEMERVETMPAEI
jgi:hypothetical protein